MMKVAAEAIPALSVRSQQKRKVILEAATEVFLRDGYRGISMDEIANQSAVSKQTIYKHFSSKEALFVEVVMAMTQSAGDRVLQDMPEVTDDADVASYLENYAYRQLTIVLTPRVMQLRRLVIGDVSRFPDLAKVLYERGPYRALQELANKFEKLAGLKLLKLGDPMMAASHFNWLVMSQPINQTMLLGDSAIPRPAELRRYAKEGVRVFLAAYGT
jgi:TetR/AcrR family transcriptional regulator, mexJK operon transcriptional repressor